LKLDDKSAAALQGKLVILVGIFMNIQVHWNMSTFRLVDSDQVDFNTPSTVCYLNTQAASSSETTANIS